MLSACLPNQVSQNDEAQEAFQYRLVKLSKKVLFQLNPSCVTFPAYKDMKMLAENER